MRYHSDTDKYTIILREDESKATDVNVSGNFDYIIFNLSVQAVLMCFFCLIQLVGIYLVNPILYYRFWISRCNKCVLLYGLFVFLLLNKYRFSEPGRLCSGDYLSNEEWKDESISNQYLIYQGTLLQYYSMIVWSGMLVSLVLSLYIVK